MRHLLRHWLMPEPIADENLAYMHALMMRIVFTAFLMSTALLIVGIALRLPVTTPAAGLVFGVSGGVFWLVRRGSLTVGRMLIPAFAFTLFTILIVLNEGLHDEGILSYAFILVLAGLLVGRRGIILYTVIVIGTITVIGVAEITGILVNAFSTSTSYPSIMVMNALIGFTAVLLYLTIDNLFQELERSDCLYQQVQQELRQRILIEQALQQAKTEAEFANLAKTNFLCSVSHELRTPLNHILGFAQLLEMQCAGILSENQMKYINTIIDSGNHLSTLIKDILDMSNMEMGKLELCRTPCPLKPLLDHSLAMIREKDFKPRLAINLQWPETLQDLEVWTDPLYLKQIMFNLLTNAVRFTPDGGTVTIEVEHQENEIIISVVDTGIGIAVEEQQNIFENFYQVDGGRCGKATGVGLGLPIAKRLVELHGGRLRVYSDGEGRGSRFSVSLPVYKPL